MIRPTRNTATNNNKSNNNNNKATVGVMNHNHKLPNRSSFQGVASYK